MQRVQIVTDSTADIPASLASALDIAVVPVQAHAWQEVGEEGIGLQAENLYSGQGQSPEMALVSQLSLRQFADTYQRLLDQEQIDTAVSIHSEESLRGIVNTAWSASQMLFDPSRVEIMDTGQVSMGMGWVVIKAARVARAGANRAGIREAIQEVLPRVRTAVVIDDLEILRESGRIRRLSAALGLLSNAKALANLQAGEIVVWDRVRTQARGLRRLVDRAREWEPLAEVAVLHTGAEELSQYLAEAVQELVPARRIWVLPAGQSLTARVGRDAFGVAAVVAGQG
jgi:DegV family protein with EDD domain